MRTPALVAGLACLAAAVTMGVLGVRSNQQAAHDLDTMLTNSAETGAAQLNQTNARLRTISLMLAQDPGFAAYSQDFRAREVKRSDEAGPVADVEHALKYLDQLMPATLGSAGYADISGYEAAHYVNGRLVLPGALSQVVSQPFFTDAINAGPGMVVVGAPTLDPVSNTWQITYSSLVTSVGQERGVVYFSVSLDGLRPRPTHPGVALRVVDAHTGQVVVDSRSIVGTGTAGGMVPVDGSSTNNFKAQVTQLRDRSGSFDLADDRLTYAAVSGNQTGSTATGSDAWVMVASAPAVAAAGFWAEFSPLAWLLFLLGLGLLGIAVLLWLQNLQARRAEVAETEVERDLLASRLDELSAALTRVARGDLGVSLPTDGFGDSSMQRVVASFDDTIGRLRVLVGQAQDNGERVAESAVELGVLAGEQADSAGEQSAAVTETTVTIQELAATASQIAEAASGVSAAAGEMLQLTDDGRTAVQDSVGAMDRIAGRVESIALSTTALGEKVHEIGGILQLLDELSDQTNLLALNAAIEAARAGEHGRGFAVVAAEVRKLAERAQESTARIQGLVAEIHGHMQATVLASDVGAREVRTGAGLAADAVASLQKITGRVHETASAVKQISVATQQQRSASDQVVVAMNRLSEVSRMYAAGSRQTASSAQELAELAGSMQDAIEIFRTGGDLAPPGSGEATLRTDDLWDDNAEAAAEDDGGGDGAGWAEAQLSDLATPIGHEAPVPPNPQ